jgi:hypothetical protein
MHYLVVLKNQDEGWGCSWIKAKRLGFSRREYNLLNINHQFTRLVTEVKSNINSIAVHPPLSSIRLEVDGALMGVGFLWPTLIFLKTMNLARKEDKEKLLFK